MSPSIEKIRLQYIENKYFKEKLEALYAVMDSTYKKAASFYEFFCNGCEDNCCFTRFYHHTFIEYFYILDGFDTLKHQKKIEIIKRADEICKKVKEADQKRLPIRRMCPLNVDSLCMLYQYRPMICRLHGVPHELNTPGQVIRRNPGCEYFMKQHKDKKYYSFDRTYLYMGVANLERDFREKTGVINKIKLTIAEMIRGYQL